MILLQANDLARRFADDTLYEGVSFNIQTQDRIALVGRNGAGKSTLIKQIMGEEPISDGSITKAKGLKIGYLAQHVRTEWNDSLSIWDTMLAVFQETLALRQTAEEAAMRLAELSDDTQAPAYQAALERYDQLQEALTQRNAYAIESDIRTVLHGFRFYEADYATPVSQLSGGQRTRLALARILLMDYDLLILDEPTNHLDMTTLAWLETYLTGYKGALLLVSHDRYFLDKVVNQVLELRHHRLHTYKGNYSYYVEEKALRLAAEEKAYAAQQATIQKLEDFVQRNLVRASTTKRAQSRRKQLEKMDRLEKPKQDKQAPRIQFLAAKDSGEDVLAVDHLAVGYEATPVAQDLNLHVRRQEAIALVGPNGVGKTTLLKTLIGQLPALAGTYRFGAGVQIGYYDQNLVLPDENLTVLETLWQAHDTTDEKVIRTILGSFLFSGDDVLKKVAMLSGGEKARLSLALLATEHDNTLILDEPTNHLDIDSKEVLEDALIAFDGTLLFVSHDRYFINRLATQVVEVTPQGVKTYLGDYDYYQEKKAEEALIAQSQSSEAGTEPKAANSANPAQQDYQAMKEAKRQRRRLEEAVDQADASHAQWEARIAQLHAQMETAALANDQSQLAQLHQDLQEAEAAQLEALEAWESASLALEDFLA